MTNDEQKKEFSKSLFKAMLPGMVGRNTEAYKITGTSFDKHGDQLKITTTYKSENDPIALKLWMSFKQNQVTDLGL